MAYEGMIAETIAINGDKNEPISAYVARPLGAGPFPGMGESSWSAVAQRPQILAGVADDLLLKVTPPRVPRHQIARPQQLVGHETRREQVSVSHAASVARGLQMRVRRVC